jgi:ribonuclease VapC
VIVIDSSAILAIMFQEADAGVVMDKLQKSSNAGRFISTANYVEAGTVLAGRLANRKDEAIADLDDFLSAFSITLAPVDEDQARLALIARIEFGRGFGARAGLNFGDSFAYALARTLKAPLLFVGDDFTHTDIVAA